MSIVINNVHINIDGCEGFQEITQQLYLRGVFSGGKKLELDEHEFGDLCQEIWETAFAGGVDDDAVCENCNECNDDDHNGHEDLVKQLSEARTLLANFEEAPVDWKEFRESMKSALCDE